MCTIQIYRSGEGKYNIHFWIFVLKPSRDLNLEVLLNSDAYDRLNGPKMMRSNKTPASPSPVKSMLESSRESSRRNPTDLMSKAPGPNSASSLRVPYERWNPNHNRIASAHTTRHQTSIHMPEHSITLLKCI